MSVHEIGKIDNCGLANDGAALLIIYCAGYLGEDYEIEDIAEKAETYLDFIESGQMAMRFPECVGRPVVLRLSCEYWPNDIYKPRFAKMAKQLKAYNIKLNVEVSSMRVTGGTFDYETK